MDGRVEPAADFLLDEHAWLLAQAEALRAGRLEALDRANLAEFLEDMAKRDVREVGSLIRLLLTHMLKFRMQPERAGRSWAVTVVKAQNQLEVLLEAATLRREAEALWPREWDRALRAAVTETGLDIADFPDQNPWSLDDALAWDPPGNLASHRPRPRKAP